jgi:glutamate carboxypeptidase
MGRFTVTVEGKEAHSGVEPHRGANAILALAQQIGALHALNGMRPGTTVNVGVIEGGTRPNVVPAHAQAMVDVRVTQPEDMEPVLEALQRIATGTHVPGTTGTLGGSWNGPPMATTPEIASLSSLAERCAEELGFETHGAATGGLSYANLLASLGLPVLDGLGPVGGLDHSPNEYILASSIVPRTALLALLIRRYAQSMRE